MAKKEQKKEKIKPKKTDSRRTTDKWKKKKWFTVYAPKLFDQKEIGETVAEKPETLQGRIIKINVRTLTGNPKKQHITLFFKIKDVQGLKAYTKVLGHEINPNFLKRVIRRRTSKMETNQVLELKDGEKTRVKAVVVSGRKLTKIKETAVRKIMMEKIAYASKKKDFDDFLNEMIFGNIAIKIQNDAKKIGSIRRVEIAKTKLIEGK